MATTRTWIVTDPYEGIDDPDRPTRPTGPGTVEETVTLLLGDYADWANIPAVAADYRAAINAALPDGVVLDGNEFHGPAGAALDIQATVDGVDFWAIAKRHHIEP